MDQTSNEPAVEYAFLNLDTGTAIAGRIVVAGDSSTRRRGLLGAPHLDHEAGLWIVPCEAIHTFGMKMRIDVLFLDCSLTVRKLVADLVPWRIAVCLRAHSVLELAAGTIARSSTKPGHRLAKQSMGSK